MIYCNECVIFIHRSKKQKILFIDAPISKNDSKYVKMAEELNKNLKIALNIVQKSPYFNYITISIPEKFYFYDEYLKIAFEDLSNYYGKYFLKRKIRFLINNTHMIKKIRLIISGKWKKIEKYNKKKGIL